MQYSDLSGLERDIIVAVGILEQNDGTITGTRIHEELDTELSLHYIYRPIDSLVDAGYLEKEKLGRSHDHRLTQKGKRAISERVDELSTLLVSSPKHA